MGGARHCSRHCDEVYEPVEGGPVTGQEQLLKGTERKKQKQVYTHRET